MQKELNEALEMLVVLTPKVSDGSGKIQWQDGYTDYHPITYSKDLKCIHKGCRKTKQPEHYIIKSEEEDDPMDGLTSGLRDLGNDDDDDETEKGKPIKRNPVGDRRTRAIRCMDETATQAENPAKGHPTRGDFGEKAMSQQDRGRSKNSINTTLPDKLPQKLQYIFWA